MPNSDRIEVPSVGDETCKGLIVKMPEQTPLQYVEVHAFGEYERYRGYTDTFLSISAAYWLAIIGVSSLNWATYVAGAIFVLAMVWFANGARRVRKSLLGRTIDIPPDQIGAAFKQYFLGGGGGDDGNDG